MFRNKAQTILTSKKSNAKMATKNTGMKRDRFDHIGNDNSSLCYITVAGVTMPTNG